MYRDDVDALAARHQALEHEVATKRRELDDAAKLLDEARARARLPVLDNIRVASPCPVAWSSMVGGGDEHDRSRHCSQCDKHVFDLSGMTREEAQALIVEQAGSLCVRYYRRADGTIMLADCTVRSARRRHVAAVGLVALLGGVGGAAIALSAGTNDVAVDARDIPAEPERIEQAIPLPTITVPAIDAGWTMGLAILDPDELKRLEVMHRLTTDLKK